MGLGLRGHGPRAHPGSRPRATAASGRDRTPVAAALAFLEILLRTGSLPVERRAVASAAPTAAETIRWRSGRDGRVSTASRDEPRSCLPGHGGRPRQAAIPRDDGRRAQRVRSTLPPRGTLTSSPLRRNGAPRRGRLGLQTRSPIKSLRFAERRLRRKSSGPLRR